MNAVWYHKKEYVIPGEWNELTQRQLLQVQEVFNRNVDELKGRMLLFRILCKMPWWKFLLIRSANLLPAVMEATEFLMTRNSLTKNLIPTYKGFAGPGDKMNIRMIEFCYSEGLFMAYKNQKDDKYLDQLIAILYRPIRKRYNHKLNPDGDHRMAFNPNLLDYNTMFIEDWPLPVKQSILMFYEGCRNEKIASNPKVFEGGSGDESLYGMWSVMRNVAKSGHLGDFEKVGEQYIDTILMELNEVVVEAEKMEFEMNKQKRTA